MPYSWVDTGGGPAIVIPMATTTTTWTRRRRHCHVPNNWGLFLWVDSPVVRVVVPLTTLVCGLYDSLLWLEYDSRCPSRLLGTGVLQSFLMSPVELIKVAQQCSSEGYAMVSAAQRIVTNRTITSGLNATLLRDGIPHGVWFVTYDISKVTLLAWYHATPTPSTTTTATTTVERVPVSVSLLSGAIAATVAWVVGYPADVIKTRIQSTTLHGGQPPLVGTTILETAQQLITEANGSWTNGLYRGFGMKLVRSIPASMIGFTVYETVKEWWCDW